MVVRDHIVVLHRALREGARREEGVGSIKMLRAVGGVRVTGIGASDRSRRERGVIANGAAQVAERRRLRGGRYDNCRILGGKRLDRRR